MNQKAKQKSTVAVLCMVCMLFLATGSFLSCTKKGSDENDPTKLILGKWELTATGMYENHLSERTDGCYWEFLPDGTTRTFVTGYFPAEGVDGLFAGTGTYEIDAEFLVCKSYSDDGTTCIKEDQYRYKLDTNQLQLIREPINQPTGLDIFITNFLILKRVE